MGGRAAADALVCRVSYPPIIRFLMLHQGLRPGYDYLLQRKLSSVWREVQDSPFDSRT